MLARNRVRLVLLDGQTPTVSLQRLASSATLGLTLGKAVPHAQLVLLDGQTRTVILQRLASSVALGPTLRQAVPIAWW